MINILKQKVKNNRLAFTVVTVLFLLLVSLLQGQISQSYAADKNSQATTEKETQQKKEQKAKAQKDTQTKQDETNKNKYYSVTDELMCGDIRIEAVTKCPFEHKYPLWQLECKQKISIGEKILDDKPGITTLWGCIQDRKSSNYYFVIDFYSGGNCLGCEWTDIYDLKGRLLMTDYFVLQGTDKEYYYCAEQYLKYIAGFSASWFKEDCKKVMNEKRFKKIKNMVKNNLAVSRKIEKLTGKDKKNFKSPKFIAN